MTHGRQPPRVATWLLHRLTDGEDREVLAGDLLEQFRRGRSSAWYWRQVSGAIVLGAARQVRAHKWLAARALVLGWAAMFAFSFLTIDVSRTLSMSMMQYRPELVHLPGTVLTFFMGAMGGWVVARSDRPHRNAMLTLLIASVWLYGLPWFGTIVATAPSQEEWRRLVPVLAWGFLFQFVLFPTSILVGGLLVARNPSESGGTRLST
jgi:hypothetical protein